MRLLLRAHDRACLLAIHLLLRLALAVDENGRIERVFRIFKETVFSRFWLIASRAQLRRFCDDFLLWHNRDRPHGGWGGRTPDEVFFRRRVQLRPLGRVVYFDGALPWYRFG